MDWKEWEDTTTIDKAFFVNFWQGPFNDWGAGKDIPHQMEQNDDGLWELEMMATWPTYMQLNVGALTISSMVMWTAMVFLTVFLPTRLRPTTSKYLPLPLLISLGPFLWMTRLRLGPWSLEDELLLVPPYLRSFWLLPLLLVSSPLSSSYGIKHNCYGVKAKTSNYFPIFGNKATSNLKESQPMSKEISGAKHKQEIIGWLEDKNKCRRFSLPLGNTRLSTGSWRSRLVVLVSCLPPWVNQ